MKIGCEYGGDEPVFRRDEGADFAFFFDDHADGDGLDTAGTEALGDLFPEQRADLITDDAVQDAAGLLGHDAVHVEFAGIGEGLLNGILGDGVEDDAEDLFFGHAEYFGQMPCDRFAFAVKVGRQIEGVAGFGAGFE